MVSRLGAFLGCSVNAAIEVIFFIITWLSQKEWVLLVPCCFFLVQFISQLGFRFRPSENLKGNVEN